MTGKMYNESLGKLHFWPSFIGGITFFPQHFSGLAGMPRRIPDYALQFADFNMLSSIGAFIFGLSQLVFLYVLIHTIRSGKPAEAELGKVQAGVDFAIASAYHAFSSAESYGRKYRLERLGDTDVRAKQTTGKHQQDSGEAVPDGGWHDLFVAALCPFYDLFCEIIGLNGKTGGPYTFDEAKATPDTSRLIK